MAEVTAADPGDAIRAFVAGLGVFADPARVGFRPLTGGVSSDIWLASDESGAVCVKRALARLKVAAEWRAPVERNVFEAAWLRDAARLVPGSAPEIVGQDEAGGMFAMAYLPPERYPLWKRELLQGRVDGAFAQAVGARLAALHAAFAAEPGMAKRFATDENFRLIRLEPYLFATARAHPSRAGALAEIARRTATTPRTVVHGDISPKNILIGPDGPVFLDAECAWFGDPAFDIAFCLNHLLLKCIAVPAQAPAFLAAFEGLASAYLAGVAWEDADALEGRAAALLPGLFLARIDGKSPVEYVTREDDKAMVRETARRLLLTPPTRLHAVAQAWATTIGADG